MLMHPNAALLFPSMRRVEIGGRVVRVKELRVRQIARMEADFTDLIGHPKAGLERLAYVFTHRAEFPDDWRAAGDALYARDQGWPVRWGASDFARLMGTVEGSAIYLMHAVSPHNRDLAADDLADMALAMAAADWDRLGRVAWGLPDWMAYGKSGKQSPGRGRAWGKEIADLSQRGWTYDAIGRLHVNQFLNVVQDGRPWNVEISDPPSAPPDGPGR